MKEALEKQFSLDLGQDIRENANNIYVTNQSQSSMRYWARGAGSIVSYNNRLLVRTENPELTERLRKKYGNQSSDWFFEIPNMESLSQLLEAYDVRISRLAPFFIPSKKLEITIAKDPRFVFISKEDIGAFKQDQRIKEAFCYSETDPDQLGLGYYEAGELKAICGANDTGRFVWEIGIEILDPELEGKGIAATLVRNLAAKIQEDYPEIGLVYGTAFSHTKSMNVAINAGFKVGFSEMMLAKKKK